MKIKNKFTPDPKIKLMDQVRQVLSHLATHLLENGVKYLSCSGIDGTFGCKNDRNLYDMEKNISKVLSPLDDL